jgi:hypothetical protein
MGSMRIHGYPIATKAKSVALCRKFASACEGQLYTDQRLHGGGAVFYGVDASNRSVWQAVLADPRREYYYIDNAYFDRCRGTHFRVTKNGLQCSGREPSDGKRFQALGLEVKPWRRSGDHVVVCEQSPQFMREIARYPGDWTRDVTQRLEAQGRPVRLRPWSPHKPSLAVTLPDDLMGAHALVTWSSAAAVEAMQAGVPIVTMGPCAVAHLSGSLEDLEHLPLADDSARLACLRAMADHQFTLEEIERGEAWARLNPA